MRKEDGMTPLETLVTLAVTIILCGIVIAMVYKKPEPRVDNTNNQVITETNEINNIN